MHSADAFVSNIGREGDPPAVSVIITAYNAAPYIDQALDSVLAQTFTDYEVIVVNDGSPDTAELERVLETYRDRIIYIRQENRGTGGARNTGIRAARGPLISLLDGDDMWEPEYLAVQVPLIQQDPTIAVVYSNAMQFSDRQKEGQEFMDVCPSEGEVTFESLLMEQCNVMVSVTARREAIIRAGMFDEDRSIMGADDFDLWLRIVKLGGRIAYNRSPLVRRRLWTGQLSSNAVFFYQSIVRVLDKAERDMHLTPVEYKVLKERRSYNRAMLNLVTGKKAFFSGDTKAAIDHLTQANSVLRSQRIAVIILLLRFSPRLLLRVYSARDRFVFNESTKI